MNNISVGTCLMLAGVSLYIYGTIDNENSVLKMMNEVVNAILLGSLAVGFAWEITKRG